MVKKIIYLTYTRPDYSLNAVFLKGLRQNGVEVADLYVYNKGISGFRKALSFYRQNSKDTDDVIIGYDSPALAIFIKPFCRKKIIYNAVLSVYERLVISRKLVSWFSVKAIYYWLLDFLAVNFVDLSVIESDHQAEFFKKLFKVPRNKVFRNWIGVDEDKFFYDSTINKPDKFTVLFRGALQMETGVEYVVRAAKLLEEEDIKFIMHVGGQLVGKMKNLIEGLRPNNLEFSSDLLPSEELRKLMGKCHVSLGQLSEHERLKRTIPHKAYESLIMRLPYLTASNTGILELLTAGETCIACKPADAESLAEKILWAKNHPQKLEKIAENGYEFYQKELTSRILAKNLIDKIDLLP